MSKGWLSRHSVPLGFAAFAIGFVVYQATSEFLERKYAARDMSLINALALSGESAKIGAAIVLAKDLFTNERIPAEEYASLIVHAYASPDPLIQEVADNSVLETSRQSRPLGRDISKALSILPVRVIVRYFERFGSDRANQIKQEIQNQELVITPKPLSVKVSPMSRVPGITEVRCYGKEECSTIAPKFVEVLKELGISARVNDHSSIYESVNLNKNRFELWLSEDSSKPVVVAVRPGPKLGVDPQKTGSVKRGGRAR